VLKIFILIDSFRHFGRRVVVVCRGRLERPSLGPRDKFAIQMEDER